MAVILKKRAYRSRYDNVEVDWLIGNVGDWQTAEFEFESLVEFTSTNQKSVDVNYKDNCLVLNDGKWTDYGFDGGMSIQLEFKSVIDFGPDGNVSGDFENYNVVENFTISIVNGSKMYLEEPIVFNHKYNEYVTGFPKSRVNYVKKFPTNNGEYRSGNVTIFSQKEFEGVRFRYTFLPNSENDAQELRSIFDGTTTEFVYPNLIGLQNNTWASMEAVGLQSGMSIRSAKVIKRSKSSTTNRYVYAVRFEYMLMPFSDDLSEIIDLDIPEYFEGAESISDNVKITLYPEWNNPNIGVSNNLKDTVRLGNVGWFNENFNELVNDFEVERVDYYDENDNRIDAIDYSAKTNVRIVVGGVKNLNNETRCTFGFAWIPENMEDVKQVTAPYYRNLFVQSGDLYDAYKLDKKYNVSAGGGVNSASMGAYDILFSKVNDKIVFECVFEPNSNFSDLFDLKSEKDRNYILYISVGDSKLKGNFSDRVTLLADFKQMKKTILPVGPYPYMENDFLEHPERKNAGGTKIIKSISQDDILCRIPFRVNKKEKLFFESMTFGIQIYNEYNGEFFVLDQYKVDLSQSQLDNKGFQMFRIDQERPYILGQDNNKKWIKISRDENMDSQDFLGFIAYFSFRNRYEYWLQNLKAPKEFYDADLPNNGKHNDWFDYASKFGWQLNFFVDTKVKKNKEIIVYQNRYKFNIQDYDSNNSVEVTHKYINSVDNKVLNLGIDEEHKKTLGVVLTNELTIYEATFRILDENLFDENNTYVNITIEIDKGAGSDSSRTLSSAWDSENGNPLIPLDKGKRLTYEIDKTKKILVTKCFIDYSKLSQGAKYRVTARVGCGNGDKPSTFTTRLYEYRYENNYE